MNILEDWMPKWHLPLPVLTWKLIKGSTESGSKIGKLDNTSLANVLLHRISNSKKLNIVLYILVALKLVTRSRIKLINLTYFK